MKLDLEKSSAIQGWMSTYEMVWLAAQAKTHKRIAEIGSWLGRSTRALADNTDGTVYSIDNWKGSVEHLRFLEDKPKGWLLEEFQKNTQDLMDCGRVVMVNLESTEAAQSFKSAEPFDMIFIDGSHDYESFKADILAWRERLAPGGLLCGHDARCFSAVDHVLDEFYPDHKVMTGGTIWFVGEALDVTKREKPREVQKTVFTLNVDNYAPEITELTYPLMSRWARKIGADFYIINDRKFPEYPPVYEKLQIFELGQKLQNDWNIFFDSDALIHPDTLDPTEHLPKDTVMHNGMDIATNRFNYDRFFRRDGRHIGSGNWFAVASDWCIDLWKPLDDISLEEAVKNIHPIIGELGGGIVPEHLIDDYTLSRNIAKFGLKFMQFKDLLQKLGRTTDEYFWHVYATPNEEKIKQMKSILERWRLKIGAEEKTSEPVTK